MDEFLPPVQIDNPLLREAKFIEVGEANVTGGAGAYLSIERRRQEKPGDPELLALTHLDLTGVRRLRKALKRIERAARPRTESA